jgi:succinate dehydrogenase/fumarate reductase-like Fe-S protein
MQEAARGDVIQLKPRNSPYVRQNPAEQEYYRWERHAAREHVSQCLYEPVCTAGCLIVVWKNKLVEVFAANQIHWNRQSTRDEHSEENHRPIIT